jgi:uncharacterized BrkB/YihY/UPF0761 family membrane protein
VPTSATAASRRGSRFAGGGGVVVVVVVVVLLWVYCSAQILPMGAEFTSVYARTFGSHVNA